MKRREFITLLGGAAAVWPLVARAQQPDRVRRVGVLAGFTEAEGVPLVEAFRDRLKELGWTEGRNLSIDARFTSGDFKALTDSAGALVKANADVIFAQGTPGFKAVRQHSSIMPVVFTLVADPVGQGLIQSLSRPGGYATGFTNFEFSIGGKWLELLMELDPRVKRVVLIANPANPNGVPFSQFIEASGRSVGVDVSTANVRNAAEIDAAIVALAQQPDGGLIVFPDSLAVVHRELITRLAATYRVPAVYPFGIFPKNGGLSSYGLDFPELYRQAAVYVDRILRGASPADLPVQAPTKFELVINLKAAKALNLTVPPSLLARADEVIE